MYFQNPYFSKSFVSPAPGHFTSQSSFKCVYYHDPKQPCRVRFDVMRATLNVLHYACGCPKYSLSDACAFYKEATTSRVTYKYWVSAKTIRYTIMCISFHRPTYMPVQASLLLAVTYFCMGWKKTPCDVSVEMSPQAPFASQFNAIQCFHSPGSYHPKFKTLRLAPKCKFRLRKQIWSPNIQMRNGDFLELSREDLHRGSLSFYSDLNVRCF